MSSRSWGPGTPASGEAGSPSGEGQKSGWGSAGDSSLGPTGGARIVIGMASFMLTLLCVVITVATWTVNGVAVLGTAFLIVFLWAVGAYRRSFWSD